MATMPCAGRAIVTIPCAWRLEHGSMVAVGSNCGPSAVVHSRCMPFSCRERDTGTLGRCIQPSSGGLPGIKPSRRQRRGRQNETRA
jgi:hypothetical protein